MSLTCWPTTKRATSCSPSSIKRSTYELFELAMAAVQSRVAPHNWQAFVQTVLEGRSVAETAQALGLHEGMIYVARCKIQKMLKREIERLESAAEIEESSTDGARRLSFRERAAAIPRPVA